jgi:hypothetical protein
VLRRFIVIITKLPSSPAPSENPSPRPWRPFVQSASKQLLIMIRIRMMAMALASLRPCQGNDAHTSLGPEMCFLKLLDLCR